MELKQLFPIAKGYQYYIVTEKNEVTKNEIKFVIEPHIDLWQKTYYH